MSAYVSHLQNAIKLREMAPRRQHVDPTQDSFKVKGHVEHDENSIYYLRNIKPTANSNFINLNGARLRLNDATSSNIMEPITAGSSIDVVGSSRHISTDVVRYSVMEAAGTDFYFRIRDEADFAERLQYDPSKSTSQDILFQLSTEFINMNRDAFFSETIYGDTIRGKSHNHELSVGLLSLSGGHIFVLSNQESLVLGHQGALTINTSAEVRCAPGTTFFTDIVKPRNENDQSHIYFLHQSMSSIVDVSAKGLYFDLSTSPRISSMNSELIMQTSGGQSLFSLQNSFILAKTQALHITGNQIHLCKENTQFNHLLKSESDCQQVGLLWNTIETSSYAPITEVIEGNSFIEPSLHGLLYLPNNESMDISGLSEESQMRARTGRFHLTNALVVGGLDAPVNATAYDSSSSLAMRSIIHVDTIRPYSSSKIKIEGFNGSIEESFHVSFSSLSFACDEPLQFFWVKGNVASSSPLDSKVLTFIPYEFYFQRVTLLVGNYLLNNVPQIFHYCIALVDFTANNGNAFVPLVSDLSEVTIEGVLYSVPYLLDAFSDSPLVVANNALYRLPNMQDTYDTESNVLYSLMSGEDFIGNREGTQCLVVGLARKASSIDSNNINEYPIVQGDFTFRRALLL